MKKQLEGANPKKKVVRKSPVKEEVIEFNVGEMDLGPKPEPDVKEIEVVEPQTISNMETVKEPSKGTKEIPSAELSLKENEDIDFTEEPIPVIQGDSLELTPELEQQILEAQAKDDVQRNKNNSKTINYDNGYNLWRLIFKSSNEVLGFEKIVLAMAMGKSGVLILVSDTRDYKTVLSTEYVQDSTLQFVKGVEEGGEDKWFIK